MNRKADSIFLLLLALVVSGSSTVCDNDNLDFIHETYLVYRDNISAVNMGLKQCSEDPTYLDQILLTIQAQELTGNMILDISDNIRYLTIDKQSSGNITIVLPRTLTRIEKIELRSQDNWFVLNSESEFFGKLPNLEHLDAENIVLQKLPPFTNHSKLTRIQVFNSTFTSGTNKNVIIEVSATSAFVSKLANLVLLSWKNSAILSLSSDAFSGLGELTELNLEGNKIKAINTKQFADLVKLKELDLSHNELTTTGIKNNAFANLTMLESLHMNSNPDFVPNLVFHPMFNLKYIYLQNNNYSSLDFKAFQQKRSLSEIHLFGDNMFDCRCDTTDWMYQVSSNYSIMFYGGVCDTPVETEGKSVIAAEVYIGCEKEYSYSCFGDVNCTNEQICVNTLNSFVCECVDGFTDELNAVTNITECVDLDECANATKPCDQICINQVGSYFCKCREGYNLIEPRTCVDIDECTEGTDECTQDGVEDHSLCVNIIGGYECNCKSGFKLEGLTNCLDLDECANSTDNSCKQLCNNTQGNYFCSCRSGFEFNLTAIMIANSTMDNSGSTMDITNSTMNITNNTMNTTNSTMDITNSTMNNTNSTMNITNSTMDNSNSRMDNSDNSSVDPSNVVDVMGNKGIPCVDVDECTDGTDLCEQNCTNTIGSYNCSCREGFNLTGRFKCSDIDECANNLTLCDASKGLRCNNTKSSYECICLEDYVVNMAMNTTCILIASSLTVEEIAGISISGFVILSSLIILLIIAICVICRRSRNRVKAKTRKEALLESARISEVSNKDKERKEEKEETMDVNKNVVYNPYEMGDTPKEGANVYEDLDNIGNKEELIVYGTVVDNSSISESMDKQLMEREFAAEGDTVTADNNESSPSLEAMNNAGYRDVLV